MGNKAKKIGMAAQQKVPNKKKKRGGKNDNSDDEEEKSSDDQQIDTTKSADEVHKLAKQAIANRMKPKKGKKKNQP